MERYQNILPRLIRLRDAPSYLGIDRNKFNADVRPFLTEIPLGTQAIAFDRLEIDAWVDDYVSRNGRRPKASILEDDTCQTLNPQIEDKNATKCQVSASKAKFGKSKSVVNTLKAAGSEKARKHLAALRQKKS